MKNFSEAVLDTSEMYCSLRFEDAKGCAYHKFSSSDIALLSTLCMIISVASLIAGA